jgi:hypothetical protein
MIELLNRNAMVSTFPSFVLFLLSSANAYLQAHKGKNFHTKSGYYLPIFLSRDRGKKIHTHTLCYITHIIVQCDNYIKLVAHTHFTVLAFSTSPTVHDIQLTAAIGRIKFVCVHFVVALRSGLFPHTYNYI